MSSIDYSSQILRTIDAVSTVRVYDATTGTYTEKSVTRFTDNAFGTGNAQNIQLHAYQYTANGQVQLVSMNQLFLTICMNRANDIEAETVALMAKMSENTTKLTELAALEDILLNNTKTNQYNVYCSMDFGPGLPTYPISNLAQELNLEVPSYVPNYPSETSKQLSATDFEKYKAFISTIIETNRERMAEDPNGSTMGPEFKNAVSRHAYLSGMTLPAAFVDLFGNSASDFTTCTWYTTTDTLKPTSSGGKLGTVSGYQVGDHFFNTRNEVYSYAKSTYGIDMTQSQSDVTQALESKMDEYNSISQEDMIELQSLVNKRDQSYTLISNALKSMNNSNISAANNLK